MQTNTTRVAYLDWLRIASIMGVLFFHSAMAYNEWGWHLKDSSRSDLLTVFTLTLHTFRMPLLFFISGTVSFFMVKRRTTGSFISLRLRRLFVPLLFGMLVIVPPQIYAERLTQGFHGSYWDFYPSVFKFIPYPAGSFSWHHLWFIFYLFVYDLVLAPFFTWSTSEKGRGFVRALGWFARGQRVFLLAIPSVVCFCALILRFPEETNDFAHDWCYVVYWMFFVLIGFIAMLQPALLDSLERNRRYSMTAAFLLMIFLIYVAFSQHTFGYLTLPLRPVVAWAWVFAALGYGKKYLNRKSPALGYINQAVYPFYILHQTVIVILVYFIIQTNDGTAMKYFFTVAGTFAITMGIYHLIIRRIPVLRFLFGMKPDTSRPKAPVARVEKPAFPNGILVN